MGAESEDIVPKCVACMFLKCKSGPVHAACGFPPRLSPVTSSEPFTDVCDVGLWSGEDIAASALRWSSILYFLPKAGPVTCSDMRLIFSGYVQRRAELLHHTDITELHCLDMMFPQCCIECVRLLLVLEIQIKAWSRTVK